MRDAREFGPVPGSPSPAADIVLSVMAMARRRAITRSVGSILALVLAMGLVPPRRSSAPTTLSGTITVTKQLFPAG